MTIVDSLDVSLLIVALVAVSVAVVRIINTSEGYGFVSGVVAWLCIVIMIGEKVWGFQ